MADHTLLPPPWGAGPWVALLPAECVWGRGDPFGLEPTWALTAPALELQPADVG